MQRGKQSCPVLRHVLVLATKGPLNNGVPAPHPPAHLPLPGSSLKLIKSGWKSTLHALSPPPSLTFERLPSFIPTRDFHAAGRLDRFDLAAVLFISKQQIWIPLTRVECCRFKVMLYRVMLETTRLHFRSR